MRYKFEKTKAKTQKTRKPKPYKTKIGYYLYNKYEWKSF